MVRYVVRPSVVCQSVTLCGSVIVLLDRTLVSSYMLSVVTRPLIAAVWRKLATQRYGQHLFVKTVSCLFTDAVYLCTTLKSIRRCTVSFEYEANVNILRQAEDICQQFTAWKKTFCSSLMFHNFFELLTLCLTANCDLPSVSKIEITLFLCSLTFTRSCLLCRRDWS